MSLADARLRYLASIGLFLPLLGSACGKSTGETTTEPNIRSLPSCPNGSFCTSSTTPPGDAAAPAPYGRCAATARHPDDAPDSGGWMESRQVSFSADKTASAKDPTACCYTWVIPCPGGRAFRDAEGAARVAPAMSRTDWSDTLAIDVSGLSEVERRALATRWTDDALYEHASVASFAQLTLDLLAFGAPPSLVEGAQHAALDEIRHARVAFALASAYAGTPVGPGSLAASASPAHSLAALAQATFLDACVGESVAAASLRDRARDEPDAAIARALVSIAEDEERHAALAWSIVAWAASVGGADVARALTSARSITLQELSRRDRSARDTLLEVVLPCADAVLAPLPAALG